MLERRNIVYANCRQEKMTKLRISIIHALVYSVQDLSNINRFECKSSHRHLNTESSDAMAYFNVKTQVNNA